jgi:hypothetical protein
MTTDPFHWRADRRNAGHTHPESFVEWTIDDLRDDYDHRFDFATESPAIKPFPTLYGE